jgi:hypothetical protein
MTDPNRAAIEAQIAALMGELSAGDTAPATPTIVEPPVSSVASTDTPSVSAPPVIMAFSSAAAPVPATVPMATASAPNPRQVQLAIRHRVNAAPRPSPMFAKAAQRTGARVSAPGVLARATPAAPTAVTAAPAAAAPAAAPVAPAATRQTPIVIPTAAAKQLPRVRQAPTLAGLPRPGQPSAPRGSSYMRARPKAS